MEIFNASKRTVVCRNTEVAGSLWKKGLGLMFRKELRKGCGLLMDFSSEGADFHSIWMPFMRFPIDIVFIGPDRKVTDVFRNVPPVGLRLRTWKVYVPSAPAMWVLELPAGAARLGKTASGDKLEFRGL
ncbi:MAG: DUF192 domain-containing protein [Candidatus Aenigmatarchaeota archaeon]